MYDVIKYLKIGYIESKNDLRNSNLHVVCCVSVYTNGNNYMISTSVAGRGITREFFETFNELKKYCAYHYKNGIADIKKTEGNDDLWDIFSQLL